MKIAFVTLSRSDYATLRPVALAASRDPALAVRVIAGGSHMLARFGRSIDAVRTDAYPVLDIADALGDSDDTDADMAAAAARLLEMFVKMFTANPPDKIFIVGDRWEMLPVALAASMLRIPIAHHSGGDITQGSADNQTRYALSMLSHIHFTALDEHAERLRRMGEESWRVHVTGEPTLTEIAAAAAFSGDIRTKLKLNAGEDFTLATFHPVSYETLPPAKQIDVFLAALDAVPGQIVVTAPNPDPASGSFYQKLKTYTAQNPRMVLHENLGALYYPAMAAARLMIGNSSSALWEAPSFGLPAINLGCRQDGRVRGANVIDAPLEIGAIRAAIDKALSPAFCDNLKSHDNPYARPDCLEKILTVLRQDTPREKLLAKTFVDPCHG